MLDRIQELFNDFIAEKHEDIQTLTTLRLKCDYVLDKPRQAFALYHEGLDEQSVWVGIHDEHNEEFIRESFADQLKQLKSAARRKERKKRSRYG